MMRALYSGVSGLRNHQISMDVIGNNIANVNTVGYKSKRASPRSSRARVVLRAGRRWFPVV